MALADYLSSLTAFAASPSETTKAAVLAQRAALPDSVQVDGVAVAMMNGATLETMLSSAVAATKLAAKRGNRLVGTRTNFGPGGRA